jgi:hypothetical protein
VAAPNTQTRRSIFTAGTILMSYKKPIMTGQRCQASATLRHAAGKYRDVAGNARYSGDKFVA